MVEAEINGHKVHLLVDTGSVTTLISRAAAVELGLEAHRVAGLTALRVYGVGGGGEVDQAQVKEFKLGGAVARNLSMAVYGVGNSGFSARSDIQGVLGWGFLSQTDVEFDFAHGFMRLIQPKDCAGAQVVYWNKPYSMAAILPSNSDSSLRVNVKLDERPVLAEIDTGAFASVVDKGVAASLGVTTETPGVRKGENLSGIGSRRVQSSIVVFPTFSFGDDENVKNAKLRFADLLGDNKEIPVGSLISQRIRLDEPDMLLGADFVRAHRIYVAYGQKKIYASYNGGPIFDISSTGDGANLRRRPSPGPLPRLRLKQSPASVPALSGRRR